MYNHIQGESIDLIVLFSANQVHTFSSSVAKFINMPVVSQNDCLFSNLSYYKLTSDLTFCAGDLTCILILTISGFI